MADKKRRKTHKRADVLIVGGGIMGCASAWELARRGLSVTVLERSVPGAEASSAAAGIIGAQAEAHAEGPMTDLSLLSRTRYPRWQKALQAATGIDVGYRESGLLRVGFDKQAVDTLAAGTRGQRRQKLGVERLGSRQLHALEPSLGARAVGGVHFPGDGRVDPRLLLRALHIAAQQAGVEFRTGAYVRRVLEKAGRARGVELEDGSEVPADQVVVAAGSWTTLVEGVRLRSGAVRPARGQIVELVAPRPYIQRVVFGPRCYIVPRDDGRMLVGSTLEFVGYRREVTARAVRDLLDAAIELVPELAEATPGGTWSNFRPYTDDELPLLGPSGVAGLTLATGHYRTGILLAPITAEIVSAVVRGKPPPLPLEPFDPQRPGAAA